MSTYDVTAHPLLSATAKSIATAEAPAFDVLATTAETLLGLSGTAFTGAQRETARLAVVFTVNKIAAVSAENELLEDEQIGQDRQVSYREGATLNLIADASRPLVAALGVVIPGTEAPASPETLTFEAVRTI